MDPLECRYQVPVDSGLSLPVGNAIHGSQLRRCAPESRQQGLSATDFQLLLPPELHVPVELHAPVEESCPCSFEDALCARNTRDGPDSFARQEDEAATGDHVNLAHPIVSEKELMVWVFGTFHLRLVSRRSSRAWATDLLPSRTKSLLGLTGITHENHTHHRGVREFVKPKRNRCLREKYTLPPP